MRTPVRGTHSDAGAEPKVRGIFQFFVALDHRAIYPNHRTHQQADFFLGNSRIGEFVRLGPCRRLRTRAQAAIRDLSLNDGQHRVPSGWRPPREGNLAASGRGQFTRAFLTEVLRRLTDPPKMHTKGRQVERGVAVYVAAFDWRPLNCVDATYATNPPSGRVEREVARSQSQ
jgi:hypothetical protein